MILMIQTQQNFYQWNQKSKKNDHNTTEKNTTKVSCSHLSATDKTRKMFHRKLDLTQLFLIEQDVSYTVRYLRKFESQSGYRKECRKKGGSNSLACAGGVHVAFLSKVVFMSLYGQRSKKMDPPSFYQDLTTQMV